jgi:serine phosphatase RsbU (regulator of sigma subunit)
MNKGDALVIVSDGITEAQSPAGGFFGSARIADVLKASIGKAKISETSDALLAEVRAFEEDADATDDLTVLVFRYLT